MNMGEKPAVDEKPADVHVLLVGLEPQTYDRLASFFFEAGKISTRKATIEDLIDGVTPEPNVIFCGPPSGALSIRELGQMLRMNYPKCSIHFVTLTYASGFDRKEFKRHGFTDAFLLPLDQELLERRMARMFNFANTEHAKYRPVKLIDITPETTLGFATSIYLPKNDHYVGFSAPGYQIDQERVERLKKHRHLQIYIDQDDTKRFYDYTASCLTAITGSKTLSATERAERAECAVRDLFSGLLVDDSNSAHFGQGRSHMKDCQEIIRNYVMSTGQGEWYKRVTSALGEQRTTYSHAVNVSTYAALFALGIQIGDPTNLALAGILHDIGLAKVPLNIQEIPKERRTSAEQHAYEMHVQHTIDFIKDRKLILPERVMLAISQHHESHNGTGYPKRLDANRLCPEAEILAIADAFDYITTVKTGQDPLTPAEAIKYFKIQMNKPSSRLVYNPVILKKIMKLFPDSVPEEGDEESDRA